MDFISTLPTWAITAGICAVFGGLGGLLGGLLSKAGFKWGRFVVIAGIAAGLQLWEHGLGDWVRSSSFSDTQAANALIANNPKVYSFIQTAFPNDFDVFTGEIAQIVRAGGTDREIGLKASDALATIRKKYAPMIGLASDEDQAALLDSMIAFYKAMLANDPGLCNSVALSGPNVMVGTPAITTYTSYIEPQVILALQAASHAMKAPVQRRAAGDDDWAAIGQSMTERGATDVEINAIANPDAKAPELCSGLIKMMETMNAVQTEGVKAVRAQYITNVAGS